MPSPRLTAAIAFVAFAVPTLLTPSVARAHVEPAQLLDGPSGDVLDLGGVALAEDGTGGAVFRRLEAGAPHVFVARFAGGRWLPAQRVDQGPDPAHGFDAYNPRIAAAPGGRLVVAWMQEAGAQDRLYAARLPRGRGGFLPPQLIDQAVGDGQAITPSIALNAGGAGLMTYRVVTATPNTDVRILPGFVRGDIRLARFDGARWSRLGLPANRNRAQPLREPTAANAPRVGVDSSGNGIVAWQEPDEHQYDRVWARRVFGSRTGATLTVSPTTTASGAPLRSPADGFDLAVGPFGRGTIALRQEAFPAAGLPAPQMLVSEIPETTAPESAKFTAAKPVRTGAVGAPDVDLAGSESVAGVDEGSTALLLRGSETGSWAAGLGLGAGSAEPRTQVVGGANGRSVAAWRSDDGGGRVVVREHDGTETGPAVPLAGPAGGPIAELDAAGSGRGDALVAWIQGGDGGRQVVGALVDAPPVPFTLDLPPDWTRVRSPVLEWSPARDSYGPVTYTVRVGGRTVGRTTSTSRRLAEGALRDGKHAVTVTATDRFGQTVETASQDYLLDRTPPRARVSRKGREVVVRIDDGKAGTRSGPAEEGSTVQWGDGRESDSVSDSASHTYRRGGRYRVTVRAVDAAGNVARETLQVVAPGARR